jgi:hypothetical protein
MKGKKQKTQQHTNKENKAKINKEEAKYEKSIIEKRTQKYL